MSFNDPRYSAGTVSDARAGAPAIDQGLRAFMLAVYNHMTLGVAITGLVAIGAYLASGVEVNEMGKIVALNSFGLLLFNTPLKWVIAFAPLGMVFWMNIGTQGRNSESMAVTSAEPSSLGSEWMPITMRMATPRMVSMTPSRATARARTEPMR